MDKTSKYSYQDCWNYALTLREDVEIEKVKNDIITLCQTVPEKFWLNFSHKFLSPLAYSEACHNLEKYLKEHYPIPYLTNKVFFYGLSFYIEKGVFVPQKDTEILVEETLKLAANWKKKKLKVLDIGTGCGNIVISLAKSKPSWSFVAVDINEKALKVAKVNTMSYHKVKNIKFINSNLFNNIDKGEKFDVIVSNPPYISANEYKFFSPFVKEQPKEALVAESDGLFFYQEIFRKARDFLMKRFLLVVEIGYQQEKKVIKLLIEYFPKAKVSIFPDWEGHPRIVAIEDEL